MSRPTDGRGRLYLCATPIGNLEDVTLRVLRILGEVDLVAAEDTRRTRKLLARHGIRAQLVSYHEANEPKQTARLIERLRSGQRVALVTDSGMPAISDPGYRIITSCIDEGIPVEVLPGPSAVTAAVVLAGLPTARFAFEGFLSKKQTERRRRLSAIAGEERTLIFFESPERASSMLREMLEVFGDRRAAVLREITKLHEETLRGPISEILHQLSGRKISGELVIVVEGAADIQGDLTSAIADAGALVAGGESKSRAAAQAAARHRVSRRAVYDALIERR